MVLLPKLSVETGGFFFFTGGNRVEYIWPIVLAIQIFTRIIEDVPVTWQGN